MPPPAVDQSLANPSRLRRALRGPWPAALLGVVCYLNGLGGDFVYDDRSLILKNPRIVSLTNVRAIWLSDWWQVLEDDGHSRTRRDRLYRPLTLFTFALNYAVHGLSPLGYRVVNVLLHGAVCLLVWSFARRLAKDPAAASIAAVLFAVHPVHAEAVTGVVGRGELLAAGFLLAGLILLLRSDGAPSVRRTLSAAVLFLLALLAKETAVCYPAVALLVLAGAPRAWKQPARWWLVRTACLLVPLLVYFPLRYVALEHHLLRTGPVDSVINPLYNAAGLERVVGALTVLGHYTRLLIVPARLSCDYGQAIIDPTRGFAWPAVVGLLATVGLTAALLGFAQRRPFWRQLALLAAVFLASYGLISNLVLSIGVAVAERLMYWPSIPFVVAVAVGVVEFSRRNCASGKRLAPRAGLLAALGALLIVALGLRTAVRNTDWANNLTLFGRDCMTYPQSVQLNRGCAVSLMRLWKGETTPETAPDQWAAAQRHLSRLGAWREDWPVARKRAALLEAALHHLNAAVAVYPAYPDTLCLRGEVRAQLGDYAGAQQDLEGALLIQADHRPAREALAKLRLQAPSAEPHLRELREAVAQAPADASCHLALGNALLEYGRFDEARAAFQRVLELEPDNPVAWRQLGAVRAVVGEDQQAIKAFKRALQLDPDDWQAHGNLTRLLADDPAAALHHARRAYELQPDDVRTVGNLAEAYAINGQIPRAIELYEHLLARLEENDPYRAFVRQRITTLRSRP